MKTTNTCLLNVSQYAAQSLTRKNCATSKTFHSAGHNSPLSDIPPVPSINRGMYLPVDPREC